MPAVASVSDKSSPRNVSEPIKQVITIVESKVKNLEKKKAKLESYKMELATGLPVEAKKKMDIEQYDAVVSTIEFGKELQKQVEAIALEASKSTTSDRKDSIDLRMTELVRIKEILSFQEVLNSLGLDSVRSDFENGIHGTPVLTAENLKQLDELYKLITPFRDAEPGRPSYEKQLATAAEHLVCLLDGKNKEVVGTTYKALKLLLKRIHSCQYFRGMRGSSAAEAKSSADNSNFTDGQPNILHKFVLNQAMLNTTSQMMSQFSDDPFALLPPPLPSDGSIFSTFPHNRSMKASMPISGFNFLQESQIDIDSPHMDPAVVSAQLLPSSVLYPGSYPVGNYSLDMKPQHGVCPRNARVSENPLIMAPMCTADVPPSTEYGIPIPTQTFINHKMTLPTFTSPPSSYPHPHETQGSDPVQNFLPQQGTSAFAAAPLNQPELQKIPVEPKKHFMNVNASAFESANFKPKETQSEVELPSQPNYQDDPAIEEYLDRPNRMVQNSMHHNEMLAPGGYPHPDANNYHGRGHYHGRSGYRGSLGSRRGGDNSLRMTGTGYSNGQSDNYGHQNYRDGNSSGGAGNYYQNNYRDSGYNEFKRGMAQGSRGGYNSRSSHGSWNSAGQKGSRGGQ